MPADPSAFAENEVLRWLTTSSFPAGEQEAVMVGIGDDLAVLRPVGDELLLIGVDQVLEGVHFLRPGHSIELVGRKAVARNLSDCAAMACLPVALTVAVAWPRETDAETPKRLHESMVTAAGAYGCAIVGGDTGLWDGPLSISVTVVGRSAGLTPLTRRGASPGEDVWVSGRLGGSQHASSDGRPPRHLAIVPRIDLARRLAAAGVTAMMDLSDGLSADLPRLCHASGVGATLDADSIPIHPDADAQAEIDGRPPFDHALHDGEDYELLFTAPVARRQDVSHAGRDAGVSLARVGVMTAASDGLLLRAGDTVTPLPVGGWEHAGKGRA